MIFFQKGPDPGRDIHAVQSAVKRGQLTSGRLVFANWDTVSSIKDVELQT